MELEQTIRPTRFITRSVEEWREMAQRDMADLARSLRPEQKMAVKSHDPGECPDGRLYTVTVRPWP